MAFAQIAKLSLRNKRNKRDEKQKEVNYSAHRAGIQRYFRKGGEPVAQRRNF
jgi:hypothetical protein